jgi:hypothetical protein
LQLVVAGPATEDKDFWKGINIEFAGNNMFSNISMVIYPAYIEHQPRLLLKALAAGIPVITTIACGLPPMDDLTIIPIGDYEVLKQTVEERMNKNRNVLKPFTAG